MKKNFLRRGLKSINTKEWIDAYLESSVHYWINHACVMLEHEKSMIIRYNNFKEDWKKLNKFRSISQLFNYRENDVKKILTPESIEYIHAKKDKSCEKLKLPINF